MHENLNHFEIFPWNANFGTGIAIIDEQHKKLIDLLNQLANSLAQDDNIKFTKIFDELAAYASLHFETEEAIWESCFADDVWMKSHHDSHASFLPTALKLKDNRSDKLLKESLQKILKFLIRWLIYHIIDSDKRMAIVVQNVSAGISLEDAKKISTEEMLESNQVLIDTILLMYDELSSRTLSMVREKAEREKVADRLMQANRNLEKLAVTDQLTGLHNRRHFITTFQTALRSAQREKHSITFIMLDIDYFKNLNDRYGHPQGDAALKMTGQKLTELCRRPGDFIFRLGGEEFGILITEQSSMQLNDFAETIREGIESLQIPNLGSEVSDHVTISIGMISKIPEPSDTIETYMRISDTRLYKAKKNGRNQVVASD